MNMETYDWRNFNHEKNLYSEYHSFVNQFICASCCANNICTYF